MFLLTLHLKSLQVGLVSISFQVTSVAVSQTHNGTQASQTTNLHSLTAEKGQTDAESSLRLSVFWSTNPSKHVNDDETELGLVFNHSQKTAIKATMMTQEEKMFTLFSLVYLKVHTFLKKEVQ